MCLQFIKLFKLQHPHGKEENFLLKLNFVFFISDQTDFTVFFFSVSHCKILIDKQNQISNPTVYMTHYS